MAQVQISKPIPDFVQQQLDAIVERIIAAVPTEKIILFGSYATGKYHKDSDLDICVLTKEDGTHTVETVQELHVAIGSVCHMAIDIFVYPKADFIKRIERRPFERTIAREGIEIYGGH